MPNPLFANTSAGFRKAYVNQDSSTFKFIQFQNSVVRFKKKLTKRIGKLLHKKKRRSKK